MINKCVNVDAIAKNIKLDNIYDAGWDILLLFNESL